MNIKSTSDSKQITTLKQHMRNEKYFISITRDIKIKSKYATKEGGVVGANKQSCRFSEVKSLSP